MLTFIPDLLLGFWHCVIELFARCTAISGRIDHKYWCANPRGEIQCMDKSSQGIICRRSRPDTGHCQHDSSESAFKTCYESTEITAHAPTHQGHLGRVHFWTGKQKVNAPSLVGHGLNGVGA